MSNWTNGVEMGVQNKIRDMREIGVLEASKWYNWPNMGGKLKQVKWSVFSETP